MATFFLVFPKEGVDRNINDDREDYQETTPGCPCIRPAKSKQEPVCGSDGKTYTNMCFAQCKGVTIVGEGKCPGGEDFQDICGSPPNEFFCPKKRPYIM